MNIYETEKCARCGEYPTIRTWEHPAGWFIAEIEHYCIKGRRFCHMRGAGQEDKARAELIRDWNERHG